MVQNDPQYFVQLQDDFCKLQEMETLKTRAGSLISNLPLAIDGYLTFVVHLALLALSQLDINGEKSEAEVKLWANFLSIWNLS